MNRPLIALGAAAALLIAAAPAQAATPSCARGGAKVVNTDGNVRIVSVQPPDTKDGGVPPKRFYGCWAPTGKRVLLYAALFEEEQGTHTIVDGRYIGVLRVTSSGVSGRIEAHSWDARTGRALRSSKACDNVPIHPEDDESYVGAGSAAFFARGAIAYVCGDGTHFVDAKGDRIFEPAGVVATDVTLSQSGKRVFYMVGGTPKALRLNQ